VESPYGSVLSETQELPDNLAHLDLKAIVLTLDQGGTGAAAFNFAKYSLKLVMLLRWDSFHRGINDVKDAAARVDRSVLRRALMQSSFIFNLAYGPWKSGQWYESKKALQPRAYVMSNKASDNVSWVGQLSF
jgi:hypothetical protein